VKEVLRSKKMIRQRTTDRHKQSHSDGYAIKQNIDSVNLFITSGFLESVRILLLCHVESWPVARTWLIQHQYLLQNPRHRFRIKCGMTVLGQYFRICAIFFFLMGILMMVFPKLVTKNASVQHPMILGMLHCTWEMIMGSTLFYILVALKPAASRIEALYFRSCLYSACWI
jgi:hypothetical protein